MRSIFLIFTLVLVSLALHSCHARKNKADKQAYTNLINKLMKDTKNKWKRNSDNKCVGGGSCCQPSPSKRCGIGEGNCRRRADCMEGLVCGSPGNCKDITVPMYGEWEVPGSNFDDDDRCCELDARIQYYFEDEDDD